MSQRPYLRAFCKARKFHFKFLSLKIYTTNGDLLTNYTLRAKNPYFKTTLACNKSQSERNVFNV